MSEGGAGGLVVQRDGKILIIGKQLPRRREPPALMLLRLNADGTRDATFGSTEVAP